ncbi:MAG TPA: energy-coupling factor transporter transmembrane component T [Bacilli bacterium]
MQLTFPYHETWLHRVNPGLKLILFVLLFFIVILIHNLNILINLTAGVLLLLALGSGHPWKRLLLYSSPFVLVFISTATGMMMFGQGSTTWLKYGLLHVTEESFFRGLHLGFRALNMAAAGLLLGLTTRPVYLFYSLMQQWRLPPKYAYSFLAAMRMLPLLLEEFQTLRNALKVRGTRTSYGLKGLYLTIQRYAIPLLAQSIRRAQRIAIAMEAKRFSNEVKRTYYYKIKYSCWDVIFVVYFAAVVILSYWIGTVWPYFATVDVRGLL